MEEETTIDKIKARLVRRQSLLYTTLIVVGSLFLSMGTCFIKGDEIGATFFISEGTAFLSVGVVGMIMSWTTMDIGKSVITAVNQNSNNIIKVIEVLKRIEEKLESNTDKK